MSRRAYNLTIDLFKNDADTQRAKEKSERKYLSGYDARDVVRGLVKAEREQDERLYVGTVIDEASMCAHKTTKALVRKWMKGEKAASGFRSRKDTKQSFIVQRLAKNPMAKLGGCHLTEAIPDEALKKMATISYEYGRWFLSAKKFIQFKPSLLNHETQVMRVCAIDPGKRTFASVFHQNGVIDYGDGFSTNKLLPIFKKTKRLLSIRAKLLNTYKEDKPTWVLEQLTSVNKKIASLQATKQDAIDDLHKRVAYDLVTQFDVIFLPTFETKQMTHKKGRKINRATVRALLDLGHYKFKMHMKHMASKYGKLVLDCNEAYTSKTGFDGELIENLGGRKTIVINNKSVDRDHNGARNILIRSLNNIMETTYVPFQNGVG